MLASLWADLRARVLALLLPPCVTAECLLSVLLPPCVTAECLLRICLTVPRVCRPVCLSVILSTYHLCVCVSACFYDRPFDSVYVVGDGAREALCGVIGSRGEGGRTGGWRQLQRKRQRRPGPSLRALLHRSIVYRGVHLQSLWQRG